MSRGVRKGNGKGDLNKKKNNHIHHTYVSRVPSESFTYYDQYGDVKGIR